MMEILRSTVVALWTTLVSPMPLSTEAPDIARVIATVILEDGKNPPVFATHEEDAAVMAVFALRESGLHRYPKPESWDALAEVSCGVWQEPCAFVRTHTLLEQGRRWLQLLRAGAAACPESPASPLSGEPCTTRGVGARRLAEAQAKMRD